MGSDPQEMLQAAHRLKSADKPKSSFDKTWSGLQATAPGVFTESDKKLARLFYDVGAADVAERVRDSLQPFIVFRKSV